MTDAILNTEHVETLRLALQRASAVGQLPAPAELLRQSALFRERFGPELLQQLDGDALLQTMHGRQGVEHKCLAYWLEYKNDDEFATNTFGSIWGGSAMKFEVFQRQTDAAWITGSPTLQKALTIEEAIAIARRQRNELVAGALVLDALREGETSDVAYEHLQSAMERAAPNLSRLGWAHKYWTLVQPEKLDYFHSPNYQRFHLFKLLQMPPDRVGIREHMARRFNCAGRFVAAARELEVPMAAFNAFLKLHFGAFHRYWRVGTTEGSSGRSHWPEMRDGGFVAIGWSEQVPDLVDVLALEQKAARNQIRMWMTSAGYVAQTATRKAGEIFNFAQTMAEPDLVLACEGETVLGIGQVSGPYTYDGSFDFPHQRPVRWLTLESWRMPESEGPRTTVFELGRYAANLLETERYLTHPNFSAVYAPTPKHTEEKALPPLVGFAARVEAVLQRKGQVILYGPPGTGKTYNAMQAAIELAARHAFRKTYADLSEQERSELTRPGGFVRLCTFHPGWGYEDFMEGLHPYAAEGQMVFKPRDGLFKQLCADAKKQKANIYLIIDEINRGDIPRVFGELLTAIEFDKRGKEITLPITGDSFSVPENVFLICTMNTADRSISLLDAALRRRFGFIELLPDSSLLRGRMAGALPLGPWLDALNMRLRQHLKRDARNLQVGHAYLMPARQPIVSFADFARVLRDDILPLLEEYCYDDLQTLQALIGSDLVDLHAGRIREDLFAPSREDALLQAVSFAEMQDLVLRADAIDDATALEVADDQDEVDDAADHVNATT